MPPPHLLHVLAEHYRLGAETAGHEVRTVRGADLDFPLLQGVTLELTVTVGISRVDDGETSLDPGLLRADRALYAGKESGRNCVVVTPQGPELTLLAGVPAGVTPGAVRATASVAAPAARPAGGRLPGRS